MIQHSHLDIASIALRLKQVQLELDGEEMADLFWLAVQMSAFEGTKATETSDENNQMEIIPEEIKENPTPKLPPADKLPPVDNDVNVAPNIQPLATVSLPNSSDDKLQEEKTTAPEGLSFKAPAAPGLRNSLNLARALRPLMRKVSSKTKTVLDEEETVIQFAERGILIPVLKPAPERWLDLALVVEESRSTVIWQEIIAEFQKLTELQGAFRYVCTWSLTTDEKGEIQLFAKQNLSLSKQRSHSPKELLDPAGRRLVLFISDCTSEIWRQKKIHDFLKLWSNFGPLAILQLFPERLWMRTAMGFGFPVQLSALAPGVPNTRLVVDGLPVWENVDLKTAITLPVVTLEPDSLQQWSQVIAGMGSTQTAGILFEPSLIVAQPQMSKDAPQLSASELVNRFRATASPMARRLAGLMATVPVSLPVVHLIQATLLKESMQIHIAEVFMSGLLQPITFYGLTSKSKTVNYKFVEGVRELLIDSVPIPDIDTVLDVVSQYIAQKVGLSIKNFAALLSPSVDWDKKTKEEVIPFAEVTTQVLRRLGGEYAALAEQLDRKSQVIPKFLEVPDNLAQLQTFEFEVATITIEDEVDAEETQTNPAPAINLQTFEFEVATITIIEDEIDGEEIPTTPSVNLQLFNFEVATVKLQKSGWLQLKTELIVERNQHQAQYFVENLGRGVELEMVSIPEGEFRMGTPEREEESRYNEFPQHEVTIKPFFMGKYPITQVQWRAVASLKKVKHSLNPYPSRFTGDNLPVGCVSWLDAVEFCKRLSQYTNRPYRLPSEAEWEYACRAVTITPFHFGETITTDLANYRGTDNEKNKQFGFYGRGLKGIYREETTDVGSFGVANAFGLYDMHGNVWEWCADHWHSSYEGAPTDGSAWVNKDDNDNLVRVLRGGSWYDTPGDCRSASRVSSDLDLIYNDIGFRVAFGV